MEKEYKKPDGIIESYINEHNIDDKNTTKKRKVVTRQLMSMIAASGLLNQKPDKTDEQTQESKDFYIKKARLKRELRKAKKDKNDIAIKNIESEIELLKENYHGE